MFRIHSILSLFAAASKENLAALWDLVNNSEIDEYKVDHIQISQ